MDEFRCTEPVTLRILQPGLADGEVRYEERSATAVVIESRGYRPEDGASAAFEFLLPVSYTHHRAHETSHDLV